MKNQNNSLIGGFDFHGHPVRVFGTPENPLFVAADVCRILEIANHRDAVSSLDDDEKGLISANAGAYVGSADIRIPNRGLQYVTESGLYSLIFKSRKPEAKTFQKWVTSDVLPSIRKTGQYKVKELTRLEILELALEAEKKAAALALENQTLSQDVERMTPKEELFDVAMASRDTILIRDAAKLLHPKVPGGIGEKRLYRWMHANGWLFGDNKPYQDKVDAKYIELTEFPVPTRTRGTIIRTTVRLTQKGLDALFRQITRKLAA